MGSITLINVNLIISYKSSIQILTIEIPDKNLLSFKKECFQFSKHEIETLMTIFHINFEKYWLIKRLRKGMIKVRFYEKY